jgi:hypothetical protein
MGLTLLVSMQMNPTNRGTDAADLLREPWNTAERTERRGPAAPGRATFHLPADLMEELRNAVVALSGPPHRLTMSRLAENALRRELDRLRKERTGPETGKPFRQRAAEVTRGRPIR